MATLTPVFLLWDNSMDSEHGVLKVSMGGHKESDMTE